MKASAREMCAPLQHQIVTTGKARIEAGERILALSDYGYGSPGGCLGINCGHMMTPFIPGVNDKPDLEESVQDISPEQAIENANIQAKQLALERSIRATKEQLHVAEKLQDSDLIDQYKSKLGTQRRALKAYLDDHPFLHRDRKREKYYEDPLGVAKQEVRLRKLERKRKESLENAAYKVYNQGVRDLDFMAQSQQFTVGQDIRVRAKKINDPDYDFWAQDNTKKIRDTVANVRNTLNDLGKQNLPRIVFVKNHACLGSQGMTISKIFCL